MLTPKDITKLVEVLKEVFITKTEFRQLDQKITNLQNSVDDFAKNSKNNDQETTVYGHRVKRLETWTVQAGKKLKLPFNL